MSLDQPDIQPATVADKPAVTPKPDDTQVVIAIIFERMAALEARVTALETPPEPEPDEYQARLKLNTASKDDRPQALANLNAAKARIRHQADIADDLEAP